MSEIKHTPLAGPWELVETHHEGILNSWHIQIGEDQVPVFPFKRICSADRTQSGFVTDHDRMAAFRIAAAAPELLKALQTVVMRIEYYSSLKDDERPNIEQWEYTEGSTDMAKARAAIAKATGAA